MVTVEFGVAITFFASRMNPEMKVPRPEPKSSRSPRKMILLVLHSFGRISSSALVHDHHPSSPAFNGGDVSDVENGNDGDDMAATKELMYGLKNHPPEKNKISAE